MDAAAVALQTEERILEAATPVRNVVIHGSTAVPWRIYRDGDELPDDESDSSSSHIRRPSRGYGPWCQCAVCRWWREGLRTRAGRAALRRRLWRGAWGRRWQSYYDASRSRGGGQRGVGAVTASPTGAASSSWEGIDGHRSSPSSWQRSWESREAVRLMLISFNPGQGVAIKKPGGNWAERLLLWPAFSDDGSWAIYSPGRELEIQGCWDITGVRKLQGWERCTDVEGIIARLNVAIEDDLLRELICSGRRLVLTEQLFQTHRPRSPTCFHYETDGPGGAGAPGGNQLRWSTHELPSHAALRERSRSRDREARPSTVGLSLCDRECERCRDWFPEIPYLEWPPDAVRGCGFLGGHGEPIAGVWNHLCIECRDTLRNLWLRQTTRAMLAESEDPQSPDVDDVCTRPLPAVRLHFYVAGPPCQPWSAGGPFPSFDRLHP